MAWTENNKADEWHRQKTIKNSPPTPETLNKAGSAGTRNQQDSAGYCVGMWPQGQGLYWHEILLLLLSCFSCVHLCATPDSSPPGYSVPGTLQVRILEWVAISFSHACMHAKSLQSCLALCDPIDSSQPGSSIPGILQTRILEQVAISFSNI